LFHGLRLADRFFAMPFAPMTFRLVAPGIETVD
jgi:hypothetical protein